MQGLVWFQLTGIENEDNRETLSVLANTIEAPDLREGPSRGTRFKVRKDRRSGVITEREW